MDCLEKIRYLLKERNWSVYKLSEMSGVSQSTLSNMFSRNNAPTIPTLQAICSGFGLSLSEFFSDEASPVYLNEEQKELLLLWGNLSFKQRQIILDLLKAI